MEAHGECFRFTFRVGKLHLYRILGRIFVEVYYIYTNPDILLHHCYIRCTKFDTVRGIAKALEKTQTNKSMSLVSPFEIRAQSNFLGSAFYLIKRACVVNLKFFVNVEYK